MEKKSFLDEDSHRDPWCLVTITDNMPRYIDNNNKIKVPCVHCKVTASQSLLLMMEQRIFVAKLVCYSLSMYSHITSCWFNPDNYCNITCLDRMLEVMFHNFFSLQESTEVDTSIGPKRLTRNSWRGMECLSILQNCSHGESESEKKSLTLYWFYNNDMRHVHVYLIKQRLYEMLMYWFSAIQSMCHFSEIVLFWKTLHAVIKSLY